MPYVSDSTAEDLLWCETCRFHQQGHCDGCGARWLTGETKYKSQSYHLHPASIVGLAGTRAVAKELCVDCYRKDHAAAYPGGDVPPLPDRGEDWRGWSNRRSDRMQAIAQGALDSPGPITEEQRSVLKRLLDLGGRLLW